MIFDFSLLLSRSRVMQCSGPLQLLFGYHYTEMRDVAVFLQDLTVLKTVIMLVGTTI